MLFFTRIAVLIFIAISTRVVFFSLNLIRFFPLRAPRRGKGKKRMKFRLGIFEQKTSFTQILKTWNKKKINGGRKFSEIKVQKT